MAVLMELLRVGDSRRADSRDCETFCSAPLALGLSLHGEQLGPDQLRFASHQPPRISRVRQTTARCKPTLPFRNRHLKPGYNPPLLAQGLL
jgi:hypothetical protein